MKIGSSVYSVSALSYQSNSAPLPEQGDDDAQSGNRRLPDDMYLSGAQTVPAPALSQALWDLTAGASTDEPALSSQTADQAKSRDDLFADLHKWANMSVAEKIRAQYLQNKGLSESDLAAMPPEERQAIEDEIRKAVMQALGAGDQAQGGTDDAAKAQANDTQAV